MEFDTIDVASYNERILLLTKNYRLLNLPFYIKNLIFKSNLLALTDDNARAELFIRALFLQKIKSATIARHFQNVRTWLFPQTTVIPNSMVFDQHATAPQMRGINFDEVKKLIDFLHETANHDKWPMLFCFYTGLRVSEVLQLKMSHIVQLLAFNERIKIHRKNNQEWNVFYYETFNNFVLTYKQQHIESFTAYVEKDFDSFCFRTCPQTLHYKIHDFYRKANDGQNPPKGFGFHIFRYYVASNLINNRELEIAQKFLGHKSSRTTERYIRYNDRRKQKELESVNQKSQVYKQITQRLSKNHGSQ